MARPSPALAVMDASCGIWPPVARSLLSKRLIGLTLSSSLPTAERWPPVVETMVLPTYGALPLFRKLKLLTRRTGLNRRSSLLYRPQTVWKLGASTPYPRRTTHWRRTNNLVLGDRKSVV